MQGRRARAWMAILAALGIAMLASASASAQTSLYVTYGASPAFLSAFAVAANGTLSTATGSPYPVAAFPIPVGIAPDGSRVYAGAISAFSIADNAGSLAEIPGSPFSTGGQGVAGYAFSPDGTRLVTAMGLNNKVRVWSVAPSGALTEIAGSPFTSGNTPFGVALNADGTRLYAANANGDSISVYDVAPSGALTEVSGSPVSTGAGSKPFYVALTPDGRFLYVTYNGTAKVAGFAIGPNGSLTALSGSPYGAGTQAFGIAISPDGSHLYTGNQGSGNITAMNIGANGALSPIAGSPFAAGTGTRGVSLTPDGRYLYAANNVSDNVAAFSVAATGALTAMTGSPYGLPDGGSGVGIPPNKSPAAAVSSTAAGRTVSFDAAASVDPDGSIVRYDWDFGDGSTEVNGGPTPSHAYGADGKYVATVKLTDDGGCSTSPIWTGQAPYCANATAAAAATNVVVDTKVDGAKLKVKPSQRQKHGKVKVVAKAGAAEPVRIAVKGKIKAGKRSYPLKKATGSTVAGKRTKFKLKLKKRSDTDRVLSALGGKVKAKVTAKFTDAEDNTTTKTAKAKLK